MRFKRSTRYPWTDTPRKRAALRRKQRLEREALPLLAEIIAEGQPDEDTEMSRRALAWAQWEQTERDRRAKHWREARRCLAQLGSNLRPLVLAYWNSHRWLPGTPEYLMSTVSSIERGRLVPDDEGSFRFHTPPEEAAKWSRHSG